MSGPMSGIIAGAQPPKPISIFICAFGYGGIQSETLTSLLEETLVLNKCKVTWELNPVHGDALISRSRSKALSKFLATSHDVCFMVDHDLQWTPGALMMIAQKAAERQAMVGGLYPCRGIGRGLSSRMKNNTVTFKAGDDLLLDAVYLATGFIAIPRVVAEEVLKHGQDAFNEFHRDESSDVTMHAMLSECIYGDGTSFHDFFRPICVQRTVAVVRDAKNEAVAPYEYLSEDWAFSWRARFANPNRPIYAWTAPWLIHHGGYGYTLFDAYRAKP